MGFLRSAKGKRQVRLIFPGQIIPATTGGSRFLQQYAGGFATLAGASPTGAKSGDKADLIKSLRAGISTGTGVAKSERATDPRSGADLGNITIGIDREFSGKETPRTGAISEIKKLGAADRRFKFAGLAGRKERKGKRRLKVLT
jgi:hypothetical protein